MADNNDNSDKETNNVEVAIAISYIAALFDSVDEAKAAYKELTEAQREGLVNIIDAAYVEKTDRSKIKVHDHGEWKVGKGILGGGAAGAVIGVVAGAILLPAAIGALIGGIWQEVHNTKFQDKELKKLADSLPAGTSALVAVAEDEFVEDVSEEMKKQGGKKVHSGKVPKSTSDSLKQSESKE